MIFIEYILFSGEYCFFLEVYDCVSFVEYLLDQLWQILIYSLDFSYKFVLFG